MKIIYYKTQGQKREKEICGPSGNIAKLFKNIKEISRKGLNYNGYGYADFEFHYILTKSESKKLKDLLIKKSKPKKVKCPQEIWKKRLIKLTSISAEQAQNILNEKLEYNEEKIQEVQARQQDDFSILRQKLINKMQRANPLRTIADESHARAILEASNRHKNTDYEYQLERARELAQIGEIEKDKTQEFARKTLRRRQI